MVGLVDDDLTDVIGALNQKFDGRDDGAERHNRPKRPDGDGQFALLAKILALLESFEGVGDEAPGDQAEDDRAQQVEQCVVGAGRCRAVLHEVVDKGIGAGQLPAPESVRHLKEDDGDDGIADEFGDPGQGAVIEAARDDIGADQGHERDDPDRADAVEQRAEATERVQRATAFPPEIGAPGAGVGVPRRQARRRGKTV